MDNRSKGIALDYASSYYDTITPAERSRFRRKQIGMMDLREDEKALEVGCGTGVLSILAKEAVGKTGEVKGIDLAPKMIKKAQGKAEKNHLDIDFQVSSIDELPYPDMYFDVVISSMMFHHLPLKIKKAGLSEIQRVLKKEGRFFLADFCSSHWMTIPLMYLMFIWMQPTRYQLFGKLPGLIKEMGFSYVKLVKKGFFLEYYLISK